MKKEPSSKLHGVFECFSWAYEVTKFWKIELCTGLLLQNSCFLGQPGLGALFQLLKSLEKAGLISFYVTFLPVFQLYQDIYGIETIELIYNAHQLIGFYIM